MLQSIPTDVGAEWFFSAKLPPDSHRCLETHLDTALYVNKRGNKKTLQTIHKPYILLIIPLIIRALQNVLFVLQTIHKLYINYTLKRSKPYTKGGGKPYTERYMEAFKTLHCNGAQCT